MQIDVQSNMTAMVTASQYNILAFITQVIYLSFRLFLLFFTDYLSFIAVYLTVSLPCCLK